MNIIVAVLFDNYEEHDTSEMNSELKELEEKAKELKIPKGIIDIIIYKDLLLDAKTKTPFYKSAWKYIRKLITRDETLKIPQTKYFQYRFTRMMYEFVNHPTFTLVIFIAIFLNTITLSLDIYQLGEDKNDNTPTVGNQKLTFLEYTNYIFFSIFTLEVIVKMIGLGFIEFFKDKFNIFDVFIVLISLIEIILSTGSGAFTSLRAFRLFRIFKIFRVGDLRILMD